ncbi:MAG: 3-isopropylmalate dehydrogenase [SAR202 cluster bacterium Io17-Chloro-G2]|nr:MAG: 3-isopropylmalate dehydrogenase [SAR202 cluster bacterium Io17-Chloro-G2]
MEFDIAVLGGDGIGPEVTQQSVKVLKSVEGLFGHRFNIKEGDVGGASIDKHGTPVKAEVLDVAASADAVLFGAVGGPKWDDPSASMRPEEAILQLRAHLGVFANIRPVKVYPWLADSSVLKPSVTKDVDLVVIRELTGGLYYALPKGRTDTPQGLSAVDTMRYSEVEINRILRVGFELARSRQKKLASVDKANVLECSRLWRFLATQMSEDYPDVQLEHVLVDSCAMLLIQQPNRYDVIVAGNTFGDILSDEAAVLASSMGLLPSASLSDVPVAGRRIPGFYEPIHGTAPDIAGKGIANPIGSILSMAMMLRYSLSLTEEAASVERAVDRVLQDGYRTADVAVGGATTSTAEMGDQVVAALGSAG